MKVVAIKTAFYDNHLVKLGEELDLPEGTKGSWFVPVDTEEAGLAKQIRAFNCTIPDHLNAKTAGPQHLRNRLQELQRKGLFSSFNEMMRADQPRSQQTFAEHIKAKK